MTTQSSSECSSVEIRHGGDTNSVRGAKQNVVRRIRNASMRRDEKLASSALGVTRRGDVMLTHGTWVGLSLRTTSVHGEPTKAFFLFLMST